MKKSIVFLGLLMISTTVLAGGSIFGGHKTRNSNPDGVSSIGIHVCDSLNCPNVILKKGDCGTVEHASKKYGVCVCDDGYRAEGEKCVKLEEETATNEPETPAVVDPPSGPYCATEGNCTLKTAYSWETAVQLCGGKNKIASKEDLCGTLSDDDCAEYVAATPSWQYRSFWLATVDEDEYDGYSDIVQFDGEMGTTSMSGCPHSYNSACADGVLCK